ncbi:hypothetical protein PTKIN_Ptkin17bG0050000 [Pterospermum kingtungense]
MAHRKEQNDIKVSPGPIPQGWLLVSETNNGVDVECYLCPKTEQRFYDYEDLMRYVRYAEANKVPIYDPNFEANMKKAEAYAKMREGECSSWEKNIN